MLYFSKYSVIFSFVLTTFSYFTTVSKTKLGLLHGSLSIFSSPFSILLSILLGSSTTPICERFYCSTAANKGIYCAPLQHPYFFNLFLCHPLLFSWFPMKFFLIAPSSSDAPTTSVLLF